MILYISLESYFFFFFFNDTATTEIYTLSLHDALPILCANVSADATSPEKLMTTVKPSAARRSATRSEEHTSELQSRENLVCRLVLEKKKKKEKIEHLHKQNNKKTNR